MAISTVVQWPFRLNNCLSLSNIEEAKKTHIEKAKKNTHQKGKMKMLWFLTQMPKTHSKKRK